jgi:hypothetical protein
MGAKDLTDIQISLVIFTCEGREHLLYSTINTFKEHCDCDFSKVILAIDGKISQQIIDYISPDIIIQNPKRKGYVNNIIQALPSINTKYFFWLEDDWTFNKPVNLIYLATELEAHSNWAQVFYSKYGPLPTDLKSDPLSVNLYKHIDGFSANPGLCRTSNVKDAFNELLSAPKGDKLGEDGFENFLTKHFNKTGMVCAIHDPVDHSIIIHAGYLESTPRNWHMTNSLHTKTKAHLLTIPPPSILRRLMMALKLMVILPIFISKQFINNEAYELCFRILASIKSIKRDD